MKQPDPRYTGAVDAALERIAVTVTEAVSSVVETLDHRSQSAASIRQRETILGAQFQLRHKRAAFHQVFQETLRDAVQQEFTPRSLRGSRRNDPVDWQSLSLVDDHQVEELVSSDRLGQAIANDCEWELRELDGLVGALVGSGRATPDRNPFRPELIGRSLFRAVEAVTEDAAARKLLSDEIGRALALVMRVCYGEIVEDLRARGVQSAGLMVRHTDASGHGPPSGFDPSRHGPTSSYEETLGLPSETSPVITSPGGLGAPTGGAGPYTAGGPYSSGSPYSTGHGYASGGANPFGTTTGNFRGPATGRSGAGPLSYGGGYPTHGGGYPTHGGGYPTHAGGHTTRGGASSGASSSLGSTGHPGLFGTPRGSTPMGNVDPHLMSLMRRLAYFGSADAGLDDPGNAPTVPADGGLGLPPIPAAGRYDAMGAGAAPTVMATNVIRAHRDELRRASTGALDHMVIDVVSALFDQVLSDPKVPPQMARLIARLQMPVLRVALGDITFFSSRRHPVRRFVNRIASLACAFDDFSEDPGRSFLEQVRALVQEIVTGDFDQMELYQAKLEALEDYIARQTENEAQQQGDAAALLAVKEDELRLQQRYRLQLDAALRAVALPPFLHEFLSQVWSQAVVHVSRHDGATSERAKRMRAAARDVVMSIQPKGTPGHRKTFLMGLPGLTKTLNEGLLAIGWAESARNGFFSKLLPAQAASMKGQSMSELDHNMLVKQLDAIFAAPLPAAHEVSSHDALPVLDDVVMPPPFSAEEAERIGLVDESKIDWDGLIDIDLSAEPEITSLDINIDGLPPSEPLEPTQGKALIDHIQLGFAYQMHIDGQWQKVRLSYVSPGRAFFVFTRGRKHQKTVSMTSRMVSRMCESGRMRAFENAYLIERATARARKQLAGLTPPPRNR